MSSTLVQVKKMQCMPYYCCREPCTCDGPNVSPDYMDCANSTKPKALSCFVPHIEHEGTLYGCCAGSEEDDFHVCSKAVNCAVANGGCDQLCRHNDTTGKDFCACYAGYQRQLTNSDGTILCKGDGPIPPPSVAATEASTTPSSSITPAPQVSSVPSGFPVPYIIAIIVGVGLLLLLLLFLLLLALCFRRRQRKAAPVSSLSSKPVVICVPIEDLKVKDFEVKVEDDDKKVKGEKNGGCIENDYSEEPVGRVGASSVYSDKIEVCDGTYEEIPAAKYEDFCEEKYEEIPANIYEKSNA